MIEQRCLAGTHPALCMDDASNHEEQQYNYNDNDDNWECDQPLAFGGRGGPAS